MFPSSGLEQFVNFLQMTKGLVCFLGFLIRYLFIFSNYLFVFFWISIRVLFISSLSVSTTFIPLVLKSFSCDSAMLEYSRPAVVGQEGSSADILPWMLLIVGFHPGF